MSMSDPVSFAPSSSKTSHRFLCAQPETQLPHVIGSQYLDVTPYLHLRQDDVARILGLTTSTLSRIWRNNTGDRKWPHRQICKIERKISELHIKSPRYSARLAALKAEKDALTQPVKLFVPRGPNSNRNSVSHDTSPIVAMDVVAPTESAPVANDEAKSEKRSPNDAADDKSSSLNSPGQSPVPDDFLDPSVIRHLEEAVQFGSSMLGNFSNTNGTPGSGPETQNTNTSPNNSSPSNSALNSNNFGYASGNDDCNLDIEPSVGSSSYTNLSSSKRRKRERSFFEFDSGRENEERMEEYHITSILMNDRN